MRRDIGVSTSRPPGPVDAEAGDLEEGDFAKLAWLGYVMDAEPRAELALLGHAVGEIVLEVAALVVVGLQRDDVGAVGREEHVVRDLELVRARKAARVPVVHGLELPRVCRIQDRDAAAEHVSDVDMAPVDHHLHRVGAAALVAVRDMADAVADALRRDIGFRLGVRANRQATEGGERFQMFATSSHGSSLGASWRWEKPCDSWPARWR